MTEKAKNYNPYAKSNGPTAPKSEPAVFRESFKTRIKKGAKAFGKGTVATAKAGAKALEYTAKGATLAAKGAEATYRGIGRANRAHQVRKLQKAQYKSQLLEQRLQQHNIRQLLPQKPKTRSPLSDRGLPKIYVGKKPRKRGGFFA